MITKQFPAYFEKSDFIGNSYFNDQDCPMARNAIRNIETFTTFKVEYMTVCGVGGHFLSTENKHTISFIANFGLLRYDLYKLYYKLFLHKLFGRLSVTITI